MSACAGCGTPFAPANRYCETCGIRRPDPRDHVEISVPGAAAVTDRGHRHQHNEDAVALRRLEPDTDGVTGLVVVVCDGVSSVPRPGAASLAAAECGADTLTASLRAGTGAATATAAGVAAATTAVTALAGPDVPGAPACTYVSAVVVGGDVTVGWVGDSRAYWVPRSGVTSLLTEDDSWLAETVAAGLMTRADAVVDRRAHAITAWLGADRGAVTPHVVTLRPDGPGTLLVCTDGFWNHLDEPPDLAPTLADGATADPMGTARSLVGAALRSDGRDNVTVAVLPVAGPSEPVEEVAREPRS